MATVLEKIKGCMFWGALGDAPGYLVEFRSAQDILLPLEYKQIYIETIRADEYNCSSG